MMTRNDILVYLDHFNNKRFDAVVGYFADDVTVAYFLDWTTEPQVQQVLRGRDEFFANYSRLNENFNELLRLGVFIPREDALFVELYTSFTARHDTDETMARFGTMKEGDTLYCNHFICYGLNEAQQFASIRIGHCQTMEKDAFLQAASAFEHLNVLK